MYLCVLVCVWTMSTSKFALSLFAGGKKFQEFSSFIANIIFDTIAFSASHTLWRVKKSIICDKRIRFSSTHTLTHSHTLSLSHTHTQTHTHKHYTWAHTHIRTHTHTDTHTHTHPCARKKHTQVICLAVVPV